MAEHGPHWVGEDEIVPAPQYRQEVLPETDAEIHPDGQAEQLGEPVDAA